MVQTLPICKPRQTPPQLSDPRGTIILYSREKLIWERTVRYTEGWCHQMRLQNWTHEPRDPTAGSDASHGSAPAPCPAASAQCSAPWALRLPDHPQSTMWWHQFWISLLFYLRFADILSQAPDSSSNQSLFPMKSPGSCWILCSLVTSFTAFALAVTIISSILFSCFPDSLAAMFTGQPGGESLLFNTSFLTKARSSVGGLAEIVHLEEQLEQLEMEVEAAVLRPVHQKLKGDRPGGGAALPPGREERERKPCLMLKFHGVRLVCKRRRKAHRWTKCFLTHFCEKWTMWIEFEQWEKPLAARLFKFSKTIWQYSKVLLQKLWPRLKFWHWSLCCWTQFSNKVDLFLVTCQFYG